MSDENNQEVQTQVEAGAEQQAAEEVAGQDTQATEPVAPEQAATPVAEGSTTSPIVSDVVVANTSDGQVKIYYSGKEVTKRLGQVDAEGSELCELEDGTTAFVPKSVLGE